MKAFVARNGQDMGLAANAAWARAYFNSYAFNACKLQLHDLRHVLIAVTKKVTLSLAGEESAKMRGVYAEAGARMSNHSLETEEGTYACETNIAGIEGPGRAVYDKISHTFNRFVYGVEFGYKREVPYHHYHRHQHHQ